MYNIPSNVESPPSRPTRSTQTSVSKQHFRRILHGTAIKPRLTSSADHPDHLGYGMINLIRITTPDHRSQGCPTVVGTSTLYRLYRYPPRVWCYHNDKHATAVQISVRLNWAIYFLQSRPVMWRQTSLHWRYSEEECSIDCDAGYTQ